MQQTHCQNVLRAYREVLHLIKRLPKAQRGPALEQARREAQDDKGITNAVEASDKLKHLYARIAYLRTATPRRAGDERRVGAGVFVLREGELVKSDARPNSRVADGKISMEEARSYHHKLLKRQHFGRDVGANLKIPF
mmetsp:Transcript_10766/g.32302  ORF Transcript_10766/g.32302 Transcript_10766/m.32302 type:complete len:138 (+) Transcript_10766:286-699(+)